MKTFHFISGLPRSGSTLLSTILNQNPKFSANISSPLARFVKSIIVESHAGPGYKLQCDINRRIKIISNLIESYNYDVNDNSVCFNTNRGWTSLTDILNAVLPNSRIICCVRDIVSILNSFEILFRKNPFNISTLYSPEDAETVSTRCRALMSRGHTLHFAYESLKDGLSGPNRRNLFIVEYNELCKSPERLMKALYSFIGEDYFEHDFDNLEANYDEFDLETNIIGLHKIRKKVSYINREIIIPRDIQEFYKNMEFWR